MIIEKLVDVGEVEVKLRIDHDDIANSITETANSKSAILRTLNNFFIYMSAAPDDQIEKMTIQQKQAVHKFLTDQAGRFST